MVSHHLVVMVSVPRYRYEGADHLGALIVSLVSILLALAAVSVSAWQVRVSLRSADKSNALPVVSEAFYQWRSPDFNDALRRLIRATERELSVRRFDALPRQLRQDAYQVCMFFDYLGTLVLYDIVSEDIIIGTMGSRLMQVWITVKPLIDHERKYRRDTYPPGAPPGFLAYYEHLVRRTQDLGGQDAARILQRRAGILNFKSSDTQRPL
jgi:hypothetical protein